MSNAHFKYRQGFSGDKEFFEIAADIFDNVVSAAIPAAVNDRVRVINDLMKF